MGHPTPVYPAQRRRHGQLGYKCEEFNYEHWLKTGGIDSKELTPTTKGRLFRVAAVRVPRKGEFYIVSHGEYGVGRVLECTEKNRRSAQRFIIETVSWDATEIPGYHKVGDTWMRNRDYKFDFFAIDSLAKQDSTMVLRDNNVEPNKDVPETMSASTEKLLRRLVSKNAALYVTARPCAEASDGLYIVGIAKTYAIAKQRAKDMEGGLVIPVIPASPLANQSAMMRPNSPGIWWEWTAGRFAVAWESPLATKPSKALVVSPVFESGLGRGMDLHELDPNSRWTKIEPLHDTSRLTSVMPTSRLKPAYCPYCDNYFPIENGRNAEFAEFHVRTCKQHPMRKVEQEQRAMRNMLARVGNVVAKYGDPLAEEIAVFLDESE